MSEFNSGAEDAYERIKHYVELYKTCEESSQPTRSIRAVEEGKGAIRAFNKVLDLIEDLKECNNLL